MSLTLANKMPMGLALVLACGAAWNTPALASTGGAGAPSRIDASTGGVGARAVGAPAGGLARMSSSAHAHRHGGGHHPGEQIATWFGPGFYGQKTACGQTLTSHTLGVASRTLPCGTLVQIDYDGRQLTVPVIDRGPYAHNGATWDLTSGAASALSIEDTVRVRTRIVGRLANTPLLGAPAEAGPTASSAAVTPSGGTVVS
jgi:rare lipoprotein A (peptidoglycan hydrolase)